ncbi:unnamed protein product [Parnassius apollo]|uniref:(apollo) hypothetical protein n=1 Tax=Parnassius apollo TaxID=110799 RepID=A0A8S3WGZ8_PARAO|nr:unnamed protein product [Parnassius apollo]
METQIIKSKPFSRDENKALLELIEMSKIIMSNATNASSNKMKDKDVLVSVHPQTKYWIVVPAGVVKEPERFVVICDGGDIVPNGDGVEELGGDARVNLEILEFQDTPVPDPQTEMVVTPTSPHSAMAQVNTCAVAEKIKVSDTQL